MFVGALARTAWRCVFGVETYGMSKRNSVSEAEGGPSRPVPTWSKLRRLLFETSKERHINSGPEMALWRGLRTCVPLFEVSTVCHDLIAGTYV